MKIGHIEIFVSDPMKSKDFYQQVLGFELIEVQNGQFVWMELGNHTILLRPGSNEFKAGEYKNSGVGIVLYTPDLDLTRKELMDRGLEFKGTDGSDQCLTFTDLDGNWFQLVNPEHS